MNFLEKVFDSKAKTILGIGSTLIVASIAYLYKSYSDQINQNKNGYDLDAQIQKLKARINFQEPSIEDVMEVISITLEATKARIMEASNSFGIKRKNFGRQKRNNNFQEYLQFIYEGLTQVKTVGVNVTQQVMKKLNITTQFYGKHQQQLGPRIQQFMNKSVEEKGQKQFTIQQTKQIILLQVEYLKTDGMKAVLKLFNGIQNSNNSHYRQEAGLLFSIYVNDEAFQSYEAVIQQDDLRKAQIKYQGQLRTQLMTFKQIMTYLQQKLNQHLTIKRINKPGEDEMYEMNLTKQQMKKIALTDPQLYQKLNLAMTQQQQKNQYS